MSSYSLSSSPSRDDDRSSSSSERGPSKVASSSSSSSPPSAALPLHHLRHLNQSMLSGAGAGLISSVVTCPLDVLKTRLQAQTIGKGKLGYEGVLGESDVLPSALLQGRVEPYRLQQRIYVSVRKLWKLGVHRDRGGEWWGIPPRPTSLRRSSPPSSSFSISQYPTRLRCLGCQLWCRRTMLARSFLLSSLCLVSSSIA